MTEWAKDEKHVNATLERHDKLLERIEGKVDILAIEIAVIRLKLALIGAIFGIIGGAIGTIIASLIISKGG